MSEYAPAVSHREQVPDGKRSARLLAAGDSNRQLIALDAVCRPDQKPDDAPAVSDNAGNRILMRSGRIYRVEANGKTLRRIK